MFWNYFLLWYIFNIEKLEELKKVALTKTEKQTSELKLFTLVRKLLCYIVDATEEELQYIVPIEYVCEIIEGTPVYNKMVPRVDLMKTKQTSKQADLMKAEQASNQKEIEKLFNYVFSGDITEEDLITKLVEMIQETASIKGAKKEDIQELSKKIAKQRKILNKKLKQQKKAELDAKVEKTIEEINNIGFGG